MSHRIIIEHKGSYVHARQYGKDNYDISLDLWKRIVAACRQYGCYNILGESHTDEDLSTIDAYSHIEIFKLTGVTLRHRVAWVHRGAEPTEEGKFVETVLTNRGLVNGRIFASIAEAKRWLLGEHEQ